MRINFSENAKLKILDIFYNSSSTLQEKPTIKVVFIDKFIEVQKTKS